MTKLALIGAALCVLLASSTASFAAKKNTQGAMTPGHKMQKYGSVPGHPGASGYAPGQVKKMRRGHSSRAYAPRYRVPR